MIAEKLLNSPSVMENKFQMEKSKHEKYLPFLQEHTDEIWSEPLFNLWNVQFTKVPRYLYLSNNEDNINVVFDASNYCKCSQIIRHNNTGFRIEKGVKHTFEYGSSKNMAVSHFFRLNFSILRISPFWAISIKWQLEGWVIFDWKQKRRNFAHLCRT